MPERIEPGYRSPNPFGTTRSHTGSLSGTLERGDRVRIVIRNRPAMYGTFKAQVGQTVYVARRGKVEMHHRSHVFYYPTPRELSQRCEVIRAGWDSWELWQRARWAASEFSWPTFADSLVGGF